MSKKPDGFLSGIVDTGNVAIVGYSMGGYGALATAGAPYSKEGGSAKAIDAFRIHMKEVPIAQHSSDLNRR